MYQLRGPYYDQSNFASILQIQHGHQVNNLLPPHSTTLGEFGFFADLDSASKVENNI